MVLLWSTPGTKLAPRGGSTYWYKRNSVPDQWAGFQMTDFDIVQEGEKNQCGNISPTIKNRFHKLWQSKAICISGNTLVTFITGISSLNPFWIVKKAFLHSEFFRGENCYEYNLIKCNRWGIPLNLIYKYRYTIFLRTKKKSQVRSGAGRWCIPYYFYSSYRRQKEKLDRNLSERCLFI